MARNLAELGASFAIPAGIGWVLAISDSRLHDAAIGVAVGFGTLGLMLIPLFLALSRQE